MKNCQNCQAPIEEDAKFCTVCGAPQGALFPKKNASDVQPTEPVSGNPSSNGGSTAFQGSQDSGAAFAAADVTSGVSSEGNDGSSASAAGSYQSAPAGYAGYQQPPYQQAYAPAYDANDHTAQFSAQDISDNKIYAILCYLLSVVGIIIALLAAPRSPYCQFHLRQAVKFLILETITGLVCGLFFWTLIVPVVGGIFLFVLFVLEIVCFFQVCGGKAKDAPIVRSCGFLK